MVMLGSWLVGTRKKSTDDDGFVGWLVVECEGLNCKKKLNAILND
jgi:hypothetical protein